MIIFWDSIAVGWRSHLVETWSGAPMYTYDDLDLMIHMHHDLYDDKHDI